MLELLTGLGSKRIYKDTGPGPNELIDGDPELGFFGTVTSTELFTASNLKDELHFLKSLSATREDITWLKFFYKGKVLFVSADAYFNQVSWNLLYHQGMIYGTDDTGPTHSPGTKNQIRFIKKANWTFKLRALKGFDTDPADITGLTTGDNTLPIRDSEWNALMYRVSVDTVANYTQPKWLTLNSSGLASGIATIVQELDQLDLTKNLTRGGGRGVATIGSVSITTNYAYRPVLEYVPLKNRPLLSLNEFSVGISGYTKGLGGFTIKQPVVSEREDALKPLDDFQNASKTLVYITEPKVTLRSDMHKLTSIYNSTSLLTEVASVTMNSEA